MKLSELLEKLDSEESPYDGGSEFFEEIFGYHNWVSLESNGFTYRPITEWYCTDTRVGDNAVYLDGELICITHRPYRKSSVEIQWVSKEVFDRVSAFVRSLDEPEEDYKKYIDFESEVDASYKLDFTNQLLVHHSTAVYQGRAVRIDWGLSKQKNRNDYIAKNVWIIEDGDLRPVKVDIGELTFPVKLREVVDDKRWMIVSTLDQTEFWSNDSGWGNYSSSDSFTTDEMNKICLPINGMWEHVGWW